MAAVTAPECRRRDGLAEAYRVMVATAGADSAGA